MERNTEGRKNYYGPASRGLIASLEERFRVGGQNGNIASLQPGRFWCFITSLPQSEVIHVGIECCVCGDLERIVEVCLPLVCREEMGRVLDPFL